MKLIYELIYYNVTRVITFDILYMTDDNYMDFPTRTMVDFDGDGAESNFTAC